MPSLTVMWVLSVLTWGSHDRNGDLLLMRLLRLERETAFANAGQQAQVRDTMNSQFPARS
jgi:hypothetical protein